MFGQTRTTRPVINRTYFFSETSPTRLFFFNDTATTEIYTLSLHDALPISTRITEKGRDAWNGCGWKSTACSTRSEEHTSELQSQSNVVCRLLLEKKKDVHYTTTDDRRYVVLLVVGDDANDAGDHHNTFRDR